ncbi:MAG TPA: putative toxin-antitoxin system toxin component, PIN family [bacterium]|jgi:putative PIN family toxin of toxin-antitoxin system|nr:putative toxin-antitoxin system toxin component, PIN family [bacterium]
MKIVLDTNVLIAAYISNGLCSEILEICLEKHELILTDFIVKELERNLIKKLREPTDEVKQYLYILSLHSKLIEAPALAKPVCRDPEDDFILAAALAGGVSHLVTGDRDLLVLKQYKKIAILTPRQAWENLFT